MKRFRVFLASAAVALISTIGYAAPASAEAKEIVLVHGTLVDGSGWRAVYDILKKDGYRVSIVQQPLTTLEADVAATRRVLDRQQGPVVLVGQSYGGTVISVAGDDPKVKALVYVAALQPDVGESTADLNVRMPAAAPSADLKMAGEFLYMDPSRFAANVAADVPVATAEFMAASQAPTSPAIFSTKLSVAAWRTKPSYGIVATEDRSINPDLQRFMYKRAGAKITEIRASHAVYISQPHAVANVIETAARSVR